MKLILLFAISSTVSFCDQAVSDSSAAKWKVEGISLTAETAPDHKLPDNSEPNKLVVRVSSSEASLHFDLSSDVRLTLVRDSFVRRDKLAVLGEAGRASAVVIFDLAQQRLSDWFFCIEPMRVSSNWISYVEWYPRLFGASPREVVLLYDLDESPGWNRLASAARVNIPAPFTAAPTQIGIPVYPKWNVQQRSYQNVLENSTNEDTVLSHLGFLLLPHERLVFVAAKGQDFPSSQNFLVEVDLSRGLNDPVINTVDIPKDQFRKSGENPNFVGITAIEAASDNAVRLLVPRSEYGITSVIVSLPPR